MARVSAATTAPVASSKSGSSSAKAPRLEPAISRANADYALRYLLRADEKLSKAAAVVLATLPKKKVPDDLLDAKAMAAWAAKQLPGALSKQAAAFLGEHLYSTRNGETVEWRFGLKAIALQGLTAQPARGALFDTTQLTRGYARDAAGHSIKDVASYVNEWLPKFAIADLKRGSAELWVMEGTRDAALTRARADGFTDAWRIETPGAFGQNELYLAVDRTTGRKRYFFAEVQGSSSIATILRVAGMSGAGSAAPVKLVTDLSTRASSQLISAYEALRPYAGSTHAIVGFKNTVLEELWRRKVLGAAAGDLARWAGVAPLSIDGLPTHAQMKELLGLLSSLHGPEALALQQKLGDASALIAAPKADPLGAEPWDGGMISARDAAGKPVRLALLRTPYGDNAGAFVSALKGLGVKDLGVVGTAGGLAERARVGDLIIPERVLDPNGEAKVFENRLSPHLSDGAADRIREAATAVTIPTPLAETHAEIDRLKARGDDAVELELSSIVEAAAGARLSAAFVVSDVPGGAQTLEAQAPDELDDSVGLALDGLLKALGIRDVELARPVAARPAPKTAREAIEKLARAAGIRGGSFVDDWTKLWGTAPFSELDVPYAVIAQRGRELSDGLIGLLGSTMKQWDVPGAPGTKLKPERVLTAEASNFDALALELDRRRREKNPPSRPTGEKELEFV